MNEDKDSTSSSRRDFLKKACKATGYALPLVTTIKLGSVNAWAESYGRSTESGSRKNREGFFELLARFFARLFHS